MPILSAVRNYFSSSIVFRLWAALSIVATVFTTVALIAYTFLAIDDFIDTAQAGVEGKVQVSLVRIARVGFDTEAPTAREVLTAGGLGIVRTDLLSASGVQLNSIDFVPGKVTGSAIDTAAISTGVDRQTVSLEDGRIVPRDVNPWQVIRGWDLRRRTHRTAGKRTRWRDGLPAHDHPLPRSRRRGQRPDPPQHHHGHRDHRSHPRGDVAAAQRLRREAIASIQ